MMEQATIARLMAVVVAIAAFAVGASQGDLIEIGIACAAAVTASVGIYLMPPTDVGGDWTKLRDHLLLSVPLAALSVVSGAVTLYEDSTFQLASWMALVLTLLVPASILEQRLMENP